MSLPKKQTKTTGKIKLTQQETAALHVQTGVQAGLNSVGSFRSFVSGVSFRS